MQKKTSATAVAAEVGGDIGIVKRHLFHIQAKCEADPKFSADDLLQGQSSEGAVHSSPMVLRLRR